MKCKKCRKAIPDNSKFCNHCGAPQEKKKLYRRPDGLYEKVMTIDGKRVYFRARKEADVYKKIHEYEVKREEGPFFTEVAEQWHTEHWENLSPTTQHGYEFPFEEIKEYFADKRIKELTHKDINSYIKQLPKSYAKKTCTNRLNILNMIFKYAVVEDIVSENPCIYITIPKGHGSKKRKAPTEDEIGKLNAGIGIEHRGYPIGLLAVFFYYTGCRKGEALALTFGDIDRDAKKIKITKSVYFTGNDPHIKQPKTEAGIREIPIPDCLLPLLPQGKKDAYVFGRSSDAPIKKDFFDKAWNTWRKGTGLSLSAHQLRHGYATLLYSADVDAKAAQEIMGHADVSTTQNIYTEVSPSRMTVVTERLNQYLQ